MNSKFNDEQIKAYAAAFEEGDAIWCDGKWWETFYEKGCLERGEALANASKNVYYIKSPEIKEACEGFKAIISPYRVTTLHDYDLQGGEKLVWLGESCTDRTFGKIYKTFVSEAGRVVYCFDDGSTAYRVAYNEWGIIPRYEQVKHSDNLPKKEPKFKVGDKVTVADKFTGVIEIVGNEPYVYGVWVEGEDGERRLNNYWEKDLQPYVEEPPAPKLEVDLDEVVIHSEIITRLVKQTIKGVKKYGDPVRHDNLSAVEWIDHAIDESIDQIVYLTALKQSLMSKGDEK